LTPASRLTEAEQNRLIVEHMDLVPKVAARYRGGRIDFDDLEAIGREGLVKAARSFDPAAGSQFSTWAWLKINSEVSTALRRDEPDLLPEDGDVVTLAGGEELAARSVAPPPPDAGYSKERIYEWDAWGRNGKVAAIAEAWRELPTTLEELRELYDDIEGRSDVGLSRSQRKLVRKVFDGAVGIQQAARDEATSYYQLLRLLKRALRTIEATRTLAHVA